MARNSVQDGPVHRVELSASWLETLLTGFGVPVDSSRRLALPALSRELHARLSRLGRRSLKRKLEQDLERGIRAQTGLRLNRLQRRRLIGAAVGLLLGLATPHAGIATVQIVDDVDFVVTVTGVDDITVDCSPNGQVRVTHNQGSTVANTLCADVNLLKVEGDQDNDSKRIDLRRVKPAEFSDPDLTVTMGGGDDMVLGPGFDVVVDTGAGRDVVDIGAASATVSLGGGDDVITLGEGIVGATISLGGGADSVMATVTDSAVYSLSIDATDQEQAVDQLTVTGDSSPNTVGLSGFHFESNAGATINFDGIDGFTFFGGDEVGPLGDTVTLLGGGGFDVLVVGGEPLVAPGDTVYLSDLNTPHHGFETVIQLGSVPSVGSAGLLAAAAGILAGAWARLRGKRRSHDDELGDRE